MVCEERLESEVGTCSRRVHRLVRRRVAPAHGCLTPRSSGAPTAGHQARAGGTLYIFASPGLASCRCRPLSSNVRHQKETMLRAAIAKDVLAVTNVIVESRRVFLPFAPSPHTLEDVQDWVEKHLLPTGGVTVAIAEGMVVAVLATSEDANAAWIDQLYVLPGFEGQGFGTELLHHAHVSAKRPVRLFTFQQNAGARRFYERHGYETVALSDGQSNEEKCPDVLYELRTRADA